MMRLLILTVLVALLATAAVVVQAQPPVNGTYKTQLGDFQEGRSATAWNTSATGRLDLGNTLHHQSHDGIGLSGEWDMCGMMIVNVQLIADLVFFGSGSRIYLLTYAGGAVTLDGSGPWGGGDPSYSGIVDVYNETRTIQFAGGIVTGANSNHNVSAHVIGYPSGCIAFGIGNGALVGDTDPTSFVYAAGGKPVGYPAYQDNLCGPTAPPGGSWATTTDITLTVQGCAVPVQEKTWGQVKAQYGE